MAHELRHDSVKILMLLKKVESKRTSFLPHAAWLKYQSSENTLKYIELKIHAFLILYMTSVTM